MSNTFDFDAFEAEHASEPLVVKNLFGKDWELPGPGEVSAKDVLHVQRLSMELAGSGIEDMDDDDDLPAELVPKVVELGELRRTMYLGKENVDAWVELGISDRALEGILEWAQTQHDSPSDDEDDDDTGN